MFPSQGRKPALTSKGEISPAQELTGQTGLRRGWCSGPGGQVALLETGLNLGPEG